MILTLTSQDRYLDVIVNVVILLIHIERLIVSERNGIAVRLGRSRSMRVSVDAKSGTG